jgi:hypothetical protein
MITYANGVIGKLRSDHMIYYSILSCQGCYKPDANEAHVHQCNACIKDLEGLAQQETGRLSDVTNE